MTVRGTRLWSTFKALTAPAILWILFLTFIWQLIPSWLRGDEEYDEKALREWVDEGRNFRWTLPELVRDFLEKVAAARTQDPGAGRRADLVRLRRGEALDPAAPDRSRLNWDLLDSFTRLEVHLDSLGTPTKLYPGQLPLFPTVYRLEVRFDDDLDLPPVVWDSDLPRHASQFRELSTPHPIHARAVLLVQFQMHAFNKRQRLEQAASSRLRWVSVFLVAGTAVVFSWMYLAQKREADRVRQRTEAQRQVAQTERLLLEEELRRREAESRHEEAERKLLEQRLATQAAEQHALELRSQVYAGIGIMAGSYAHNIKNLLVRPNDLLRRCLEVDTVSPDQRTMLHEVQHTLGTVTERLQQILRTVRRDPSRAERVPLDLNAVVREMGATWTELARERWKLELTLDLAPMPLRIPGDPSHLQQAIENLLFNARDATFEQRNFLRDQAHRASSLDPAARKQALIAAAAWRGAVTLTTRQEGTVAVLEVCDNGGGMTEEVRRRCTETHFSTKRDNALYEGHSTGMGLGLSFVLAILENHRASLEIESSPHQGALFRARFPLSPE